MPDYKLFSGNASLHLSKEICRCLGCDLGEINITHFSDGEFAVSYEESIRGKDVFLVQSTYPNSDNLMELLLMVDAAKRASAKSIVAVVPYFGWARQDKKDKPRVSIGALEEIVFTDSIPYIKNCSKLKQLSVAPLFAEAIRRVLINESISDLYLMK